MQPEPQEKTQDAQRPKTKLLECKCAAWQRLYTISFDAQDLREWGKVTHCMFCGKEYPDAV